MNIEMYSNHSLSIPDKIKQNERKQISTERSLKFIKKLHNNQQQSVVWNFN